MDDIMADQAEFYPICRTYWGSHGCGLEKGHEGHHFCCCGCENHPDPDSGCVGKYPYYETYSGKPTEFYGEDA
jgi:hypothetical protein